ncbi:MAG: hypothetical protein WCT05_15095 [Lentisphaeria bacterium]
MDQFLKNGTVVAAESREYQGSYRKATICQKGRDAYKDENGENHCATYGVKFCNQHIAVVPSAAIHDASLLRNK